MPTWSQETPTSTLTANPNLSKATARRFRPRLGRRLHTALSRGSWQYPLLMTVILSLATAGLLLWRYQAGAVDYHAGSVADRTIKATRQVQYTSALRTAAAKRAAIEDASLITYIEDTRIADGQVRKFDMFANTIEDAKGDTGISLEMFRMRTANATPPNLPVSDINALFMFDTLSRVRVTHAVEQTLKQILSDRKIRPGAENVVQIQLNPNNIISTDLLTIQENAVALDIVRVYIVPNMVEDVAETRAAQQRASAAVPDVKVRLLQGEVLVREGDVVTDEQVEKLEALGLRTPNLSVQRVLGLLGFVAALIGLLAIFLWRGVPGGWRGTQVWLLLLSLISVTAVARFLLPGHTVAPYLFPLAGVSMVLALLISTEIAVASTVYLALLAAFVTEQTLALGVMFLVTGLVGIALAERAQTTAAFLWSALALAAIGTVVATSYGLLSDTVDAVGMVQRVSFAALNGALSAGIAFIGVTLLARLFGIVTPFQLLELGHPKQPLLAKMAHVAPGTYYHSMIVGNLAEKAVEAIGGDPLLARVAVWYHDIGKSLHPSYFIENQANIANIHDTLDPYLSARILINHVRDGVPMAEAARLPQPIVDVIAQHHGTMRTEMFYRRAKEQDGDTVDESLFRYPGPIPQTREAAVIMLADATEAATRAANRAGKLNPPGNGANAVTEEASTAVIRKIVENIVKERMTDGQLADAPLTMHDLTVIQRTFVNVLDGMYHPRLEYPEPDQAPAQASADPTTSPLGNISTRNVTTTTAPLPLLESLMPPAPPHVMDSGLLSPVTSSSSLPLLVHSHQTTEIAVRELPPTPVGVEEA